ncbi:arsenate reductase [Glaciecola siphonariae]|uniref:Arsenate reductase n=1 Tax=Glaciecola siphonariae TaxID=521012 RepID=A0ABV9LVT9_9ALTE
MTIMYGIANCDTVKKAKTWLSSNNINYSFHDYKKAGVEIDFIASMINAHGVQTVVNKRGTTYRKLSDDQKAVLEAANENEASKTAALALIQENTSMIKRPILVHQGDSYIGFTPDLYSSIFKTKAGV